MAIRVTLECGHASALRARTTAEGYTHDWEVFVRGVDNADVHQYIDRVVFQLHETFQRPKRVLKEPPFVVKESGYAGFLIPIEIYLKNKDEPKKFQILYDLHLQPSGPFSNVIRHTETINNPSEEFRRKLLKGGGVPLSSSDGQSEKSEAKTPNMVGKPKLSGSESKKHRLTEPKTSNSFTDLFGTPIKPAKVSPDNKKVNQSDKNSNLKSASSSEKLEKLDKSIKVKDSPHKEKKPEKLGDKKEKKVKDASKERNRSKEKSKRPSSPGNKSHSSPLSKRPPSPLGNSVSKKPVSPLPPSVKAPSSPKHKEKEAKKSQPEKERDKEKEKEKAKESSKSVIDPSKSEKKKDKKHKEDRDKEKKDKYKDRERSNVKDVQKTPDKKSEKPEKPEKSEKDKSQEYKSAKDGKRSPKPSKEGSDKVKEEKPTKVEKPEKTEKSEKTKDGKSDKDKQKHKHKKREKKERRDSSREREKKEKREKNKAAAEKQSNASATPMTNPLSTLLAEMPERDSSDSAPSMDDDSFPEPKAIPALKKEPENTIHNPLAEPSKSVSPALPSTEKKEKGERSRKEGKTKGSKLEERENRKRKRKSESKAEEEHLAKREKARERSPSPLLEPVSSSQSPVAVDEGIDLKDKDDTMDEPIENNGEAEQVAPDSTNSTLVESDVAEPPVFSDDYVSQLRDLQQKIMMLQDNQELQRVVQVIAETGQYEITKKTFDFDLCALDRRTVQRLQQFFSAS